jgi:hypothetical protein
MIRLFLSLPAVLLAAQLARAADSAPLAASWLDNDVLRLRVEHLTGNFPTQWLAVQPTNAPSGLILDLRAADGEKTIAAPAGGFFADKNLPLVILVNSQTRGAAATWATDLRKTGGGILVSSTNSFGGQIKPDVFVSVSGEDEKKFLTDPFYFPAPAKNSGLAPTNEFLPFIDHTSEADLVRKHVKDGEDDVADTPRAAPAQPVIRDPALARAVDLLKALAVLKQARG